MQLDASNGVLRLCEEGRDGKWVDFPYQAMRLESTLRPQGIDSRLLFQGERLGLQVDARIDPRPLRKPLSGDFRLEGLDLAVLRPFVTGVEELEGQLDGAGTLGGTLLAPNVLGQVRLHGGKLAGGDLPTRIEDLTLDARIAGESLELSGAWHSGEKGRGTLSGTLAWSQGLDMDLAVRGNALPVVVEPYANLDVDPDLRVRMADQRLALTGKVRVPRGRSRSASCRPRRSRSRRTRTWWVSRRTSRRRCNWPWTSTSRWARSACPSAASASPPISSATSRWATISPGAASST